MNAGQILTVKIIEVKGLTEAIIEEIISPDEEGIKTEEDLDEGGDGTDHPIHHPEKIEDRLALLANPSMAKPEN